MGLASHLSVSALVVGVMSCGAVTGTTDTSTTTVSTPSCATGETCVIGDTGPGGGIVFYVSAAVINTVSGVSAGGRNLEAAPNTWNGGASDSRAEWGCNEILIGGADGTDVGTGAQNTKDIDTGCTTSGIAADMAINLVFGGQSDWFLPSLDELGLMFENLFAKDVGGFALFDYWSSSEHDVNRAWIQSPSHGYQGDPPKGEPFDVRPIRAFG